jgi:hypothetical protein
LRGTNRQKVKKSKRKGEIKEDNEADIDEGE